MNVPERPARRRGRPRGFDAAAVTESAMQAFWEHGLTTATTGELCAATGLSTSSLYAFFGSREGAAKAAVEHYLQTVIDGRIVGPMGRGSAGLADVRAFLERLDLALRETPGRGCLIVSAMAAPGPDPTRRQAAVDYRRRLRAALRAALDRAQAAGEIPADAIEMRVQALAALVVTLNLLSADGAEDEAQATLAAALALLGN